MNKGKRYFSGFSDMDTAELKHQKELWEEARDYADMRNDASRTRREINSLIFMRYIYGHLGKIAWFSLFVLLMISLCIQ